MANYNVTVELGSTNEPASTYPSTIDVPYVKKGDTITVTYYGVADGTPLSYRSVNAYVAPTATSSGVGPYTATITAGSPTLVQRYAQLRQDDPNSKTNYTATINFNPYYGFEVFNSSGTLLLSTTDIAALYKSSYTGSVSTTTGQKTLTTNISAPGVLTTDIVFVEDAQVDEIRRATIPSNGTITYTSTILDATPPTSWTSIYKITVISKGDT